MASSTKTVHIVGGGLAGSEAAWQLAPAGVPVVLHEMRPVRGTEAHLTDRLAELVCSNSFRSDDAENNAVGLLHEEMRRAGSLIMRAADAAQAAGGRRAGGRPRTASPPPCSEALLAHPLVDAAARGGRRPAAGRLGQRHRRHRPPHLAGAGRGDPARLSGEESLAFFDAIAPIVHHESIDLSIAWKQSRYDKAGPGGGGADYINCPLDKDAVRRLRRGPAGRRQDRVQGVGAQHALLRGLPADRGDGRARAADAALRADEAGRPERSAHRPAAVGGRAAAPGQCARHAVEHRRLPDQAEARRAGAAVPHHPRPAATPSSRGWAGCTATPSSTARACSTRTLAAEGDAAAALRRPDHRLRGLCRERRRRPHGRPLRRRRAAGASAERAAGRRRRWARCSATSPAAPTPRPSSR